MGALLNFYWEFISFGTMRRTRRCRMNEGRIKGRGNERRINHCTSLRGIQWRIG